MRIIRGGRNGTLSLAAVVLAIAVTTAMDATGLTAFSALPLCPLALLLWYVAGGTRRGVGLTLGTPAGYGFAVAYPVVVLVAMTAIALGAHAADVAHFNWRATLANVAIGAVATTIVAFLTEEGFFRGVLWGSLREVAPKAVLLQTSIAFALWHVSAVTLPTGFDLPRAQVPLFLVNAAVMGAIWGVLRRMSGSILVSSVSHGLWNGLVYALFGFGTKGGALGVRNTSLFGPEVGAFGLAVNAFALLAFLTMLEPRVAKTLNNTERNSNTKYFSS